MPKFSVTAVWIRRAQTYVEAKNAKAALKIAAKSDMDFEEGTWLYTDGLENEGRVTYIVEEVPSDVEAYLS